MTKEVRQAGGQQCPPGPATHHHRPTAVQRTAARAPSTVTRHAQTPGCRAMWAKAAQRSKEWGYQPCYRYVDPNPRPEKEPQRKAPPNQLPSLMPNLDS